MISLQNNAATCAFATTNCMVLNTSDTLNRVSEQGKRDNAASTRWSPSRLLWYSGALGRRVSKFKNSIFYSYIGPSAITRAQNQKIDKTEVGGRGWFRQWTMNSYLLVFAG
uniref:Uncharacterized protein n=1 Tax=Anguilla anguilla TaxID=7936 RepID=A0A0E9X6N7_ANGAN